MLNNCVVEGTSGIWPLRQFDKISLEITYSICSNYHINLAKIGRTTPLPSDISYSVTGPNVRHETIYFPILNTPPLAASMFSLTNRLYARF